MTEVYSDMEMFEMDCAHTAEVVMNSLCSFENNDAFILTDVNENLFRSSFMDVVARYLGGIVVSDNVISFMGKRIVFELTIDMIMYDNIEQLEVSYYIQ